VVKKEKILDDISEEEISDEEEMSEEEIKIVLKSDKTKIKNPTKKKC
jgi:hypothetical protein